MIVAIIVGLLVHYRRILQSRSSEVDGVSTYPVSMKKVEMSPKTVSALWYFVCLFVGSFAHASRVLCSNVVVSRSWLSFVGMYSQRSTVLPQKAVMHNVHFQPSWVILTK